VSALGDDSKHLIGQLSPDDAYYWDGKRWQPAVSLDGAWWWNGRQWVPTRTELRATNGEVLVSNPFSEAYGLPPRLYYRGMVEQVDLKRMIWSCNHNHYTPEEANRCARREVERRSRR